MEVDEVPDEGNVPPVLGEDVIMMIYEGRPLPRTHRVSNPSLLRLEVQGRRDVRT
jgi:hypothetical protein